MDAAKDVLAWVVVGLVGLAGAAIVWAMFTGKIDLSKLISEGEDGKGSMSRFQLLVFTFVIAGTVFMITISSDPPAFPETIPPEILGLLGISGGSYVLSKGVGETGRVRRSQFRSQVEREDLLSKERITRGPEPSARELPPTVGETMRSSEG